MLTECENAPNVKIKSKSVFNTTFVSCKRTYSRASELSIYMDSGKGGIAYVVMIGMLSIPLVYLHPEVSILD